MMTADKKERNLSLNVKALYLFMIKLPWEVKMSNAYFKRLNRKY